MQPRAILALGLAIVGCGSPPLDNPVTPAAMAALASPESLELLSLQPHADKSDEGFHGWQVLGKTTIEDKPTIAKLCGSFTSGIPEHRGPVVSCFSPRHGLRVTSGGKVVDFVICFECFAVETYLDGQILDRFISIDRDPQAVFDEVLGQSNIQLADKP